MASTAVHRCGRCNRPMKRQSFDGLGPTCRMNLTGAKPQKRVRAAQPVDDKQLALEGIAA